MCIYFVYHQGFSKVLMQNTFKLKTGLYMPHKMTGMAQLVNVSFSINHTEVLVIISLNVFYSISICVQKVCKVLCFVNCVICTFDHGKWKKKCCSFMDCSLDFWIGLAFVFALIFVVLYIHLVTQCQILTYPIVLLEEVSILCQTVKVHC